MSVFFKFSEGQVNHLPWIRPFVFCELWVSFSPMWGLNTGIAWLSGDQRLGSVREMRPGFLPRDLGQVNCSLWASVSQKSLNGLFQEMTW
jgi:hypothetical protein